MMNFWTPTFPGWSDGLDLSTLPWQVEYEFIEIWNFNESTNDFELAFRDDFDDETVDSSRWIVSDNWQFNQSDTLFKSDQVQLMDGKLVLKMEPWSQISAVEELLQ